MFNSWNQTLITMQAAGPALSNTTSAGSLLNGQAKFTLPAGFLGGPGSKLRIKAGGVMSTAASSPGTFQWQINFGGVQVYSGGASGTLATSAVNLPWKLEIDVTARVVGSGSAASVEASGVFQTAALSATTPIQLLACPGPATGFDSTVSFFVDLLGSWSVASASNSITCHDYELVSLN